MKNKNIICYICLSLFLFELINPILLLLVILIPSVQISGIGHVLFNLEHYFTVLHFFDSLSINVIINLMLIGLILSFFIVTLIFYIYSVINIFQNKYSWLGFFHVLMNIFIILLSIVIARGETWRDNASKVDFVIGGIVQIVFSLAQLSFLIMLFLKTRKESKLEIKEQ